MSGLFWSLILLATVSGCNVQDVDSVSSEQSDSRRADGIEIGEKSPINVNGTFRGKISFFPRGAVAVVFHGFDRGSEKFKLNGRTYEVAAHGGKDGGPFVFVNESDETVTKVIEVTGKDAQFEVWKYRWAEQHVDRQFGTIFPADYDCTEIDHRSPEKKSGKTGSYHEVWLSLQTGEPVRKYADRCI